MLKNYPDFMLNERRNFSGVNSQICCDLRRYWFCSFSMRKKRKTFRRHEEKIWDLYLISKIFGKYLFAVVVRISGKKYEKISIKFANHMLFVCLNNVLVFLHGYNVKNITSWRNVYFDELIENGKRNFSWAVQVSRITL